MRSMTACRHARQYKALKPPKCGCDMCHMKWLMKFDYAELEVRLLALCAELRYERQLRHEPAVVA
jgi:hypothetical protein